MSRYIIKVILICHFIYFAFASSSVAQRCERPAWRDKIFFGGNFGLQFGTITDIELSPSVGYWITPRFASGLGFIYEYYEDRRIPSFKIKTNIYGGRVFSKLVLIKDLGQMIPVGISGSLFAHAEYEGLSLERKYFNKPTYGEGRFLLNSVLVGGGLSQKIGQRASINITVLYNLNETLNTPYRNPIVRFGFSF